MTANRHMCNQCFLIEPPNDDPGILGFSQPTRRDQSVKVCIEVQGPAKGVRHDYDHAPQPARTLKTKSGPLEINHGEGMWCTHLTLGRLSILLLTIRHLRTKFSV